MLAKSDMLQEAAEKKAQDMIENNYFAHTSPQGKTPWHWVEESGYDYRYAGENLAINQLYHGICRNIAGSGGAGGKNKQKHHTHKNLRQQSFPAMIDIFAYLKHKK